MCLSEKEDGRLLFESLMLKITGIGGCWRPALYTSVKGLERSSIAMAAVNMQQLSLDGHHEHITYQENAQCILAH